jgi:hypothetical protein
VSGKGDAVFTESLRIKKEVMSARKSEVLDSVEPGHGTLLRSDAITVYTNGRLVSSRNITIIGTDKVKISCVSLHDPFPETVEREMCV